MCFPVKKIYITIKPKIYGSVTDMKLLRLTNKLINITNSVDNHLLFNSILL